MTKKPKNSEENERGEEEKLRLCEGEKMCKGREVELLGRVN